MQRTFTLPELPSPLLLPEVTCSNQQPLPNERANIHHALAKLKDTQIAVDEIFERVQKLKLECERRVSELESSLAPCRMLPHEIWSHIFCMVMLADEDSRVQSSLSWDETSTAMRWLSPGPVITALSLVCRMWRRVILNTPWVWRHLPSRAPWVKAPSTSFNQAIQRHISRAGVVPLTVSASIPVNPHLLHHPETKEYLDILHAALPRTSSFECFVLGGAGFPTLSALPQACNRLEELKLTISVSGHVNHNSLALPMAPWPLFQQCPRLSSMSLKYSRSSQPATDWFLFPLSNLTHLSATGIYRPDFYTILQSAPNLSDATFFIVPHLPGEAIAVVERSQKADVTCPNLRRCMLLSSDKEMMSMLGKMRTPNLARFALGIPVLSESVMSFIIGAVPCHSSNLTHLLLDMTLVPWTEIAWTMYVILMPNVSHLSLHVAKLPVRKMGSFFDRLVHTTDPILPALKRMLITCHPLDLEEESLAVGDHWLMSLKALAAARFKDFPSDSKMRCGMTGLRIVYPEDVPSNPEFAVPPLSYLLNGWGVIRPSECPSFDRLTGVLSLTVRYIDRLKRVQRSKPNGQEARNVCVYALSITSKGH